MRAAVRSRAAQADAENGEAEGAARRRGAAPSAGGARPHPLLLSELLVAGQECARPDKSRRRRPPEWAGGKSLPILFWRRFPRGFPVRNMKLASSGSFGFGDGHHQVMVVPLAVR